MTTTAKIPQNTGAAAAYIDRKLADGLVSFSLADLCEKTGLSVIAARNQLLRLGNSITRTSPRQQYFLIVTPESTAFDRFLAVRFIDTVKEILDETKLPIGNF